MNVFSRIVVVFLCLAVVAGAVSLIVLAWSIPNNSVSWLRDAVDWLDDHNTDTNKAILTAAASAVAFVSLIVIVMELLPQSSATVKVTDLQIGDASLSTAAIAQRVEEGVRAVRHVSDVRASIRSKRKGVLVDLDLRVDPEANLAVVTDEALEAARDTLLNRVHVSLAAPPRARLQYRELRTTRAAAAAARARPAAPAGGNGAPPALPPPSEAPVQTPQPEAKVETHETPMSSAAPEALAGASAGERLAAASGAASTAEPAPGTAAPSSEALAEPAGGGTKDEERQPAP